QCRQNLSCAIVGPLLAKRYGWRPGQRVSLRQNGAGLADGPPGFWTLDFVIVGVLKSTPYPNQFLLRREYLEQAVKTRGWDDRDLADFIFVRIAGDADREKAARAIDGLFHASPYETRTQTEKGVFQSALSIFGNLSAAARILSSLMLINIVLIVATSVA